MRRISVIAVALAFWASWSHAQTPAVAAASKLLPGTKGSVLSSIQGSAQNSTNGSMPDTFVRLRDARYGRIVNSTLTDKQGVFVFRGVDPGNYVVEVMNPANNAVLASSQMMSVGPGEAISALVKMPFRIPPIAGLLGNSSQTTAQAVSSAAQAVTAAAASSNTVAETLTGAASTSNTSNNAR
jgi:hypothetical protein